MLSKPSALPKDTDPSLESPCNQTMPRVILRVVESETLRPQRHESAATDCLLPIRPQENTLLRAVTQEIMSTVISTTIDLRTSVKQAHPQYTRDQSQSMRPIGISVTGCILSCGSTQASNETGSVRACKAFRGRCTHAVAGRRQSAAPPHVDTERQLTSKS